METCTCASQTDVPRLVVKGWNFRSRLFPIANNEQKRSCLITQNPDDDSKDCVYVLTLLLHGGAMLTTIRRLGNSQGILIPKPLLQQVGLEDQAELRVEGDSLVL